MPIIPLKSPLGLAALACLAASMSASATVSLQFSSTTLQATNWADGTGVGGTSLVWGIIVDGDGDGLAPTYLTAGVDYGRTTAAPGSGQALTDGNGVVTDDVLFINFLTMTILSASFEGRDGGHQGQNRISNLSSVELLNGVDAGDAFYVVWFDRAGAPASTPSGTPQPGEKFGVFGDAAFTLPSNGSTVSYWNTFAGPDPLHQMNYQFVPEPATAGLALLGALGLMRRRRA